MSMLIGTIGLVSICFTFGAEIIENVSNHPGMESIDLYHLVNNLENKREISWFADAEFCSRNPRSNQCSVKAICEQWKCDGNIRCRFDDAVPSQYVIDVIHIDTVTVNGTSAKLGGCLFLEPLPATVQAVVVVGHHLTSVDLSELRTKCLQHLNLANNQISEINFADFEGSSVEYLDLQRNLVESINLGDLMNSKLQFIDLRYNQIHSVQFTESEVQPLFNPRETMRYLHLDGNPLDFASQTRWKYLQLRVLHARNEMSGYHVAHIMNENNLCRNCVSMMSAAVMLGIVGRMLMRRN